MQRTKSGAPTHHTINHNDSSLCVSAYFNLQREQVKVHRLPLLVVFLSSFCLFMLVQD